MAINFPNPSANNPDTNLSYGSGWYNAANGITYSYSNNVWTALSTPTGEFDARYVQVDGDNMTDDLTLGPVGDPKITLDATGSLTVDDLILAKQLGTTQRIFCGPALGVNTNNAFEVNDKDDSRVVASITGEGSAEFDGPVSLFDRATTGYGINLASQGSDTAGFSPYIRVQAKSGTNTDKTPALRFYTDSDLKLNVTSSGIFEVGGTINGSDPNLSLPNIQLNGIDGSAYFKADINPCNNRMWMQLTDTGSVLRLGSSNVVSNSSSQTIVLDGRNGSASFAGDIKIADSDNADTGGISLTNNGYLAIRRPSTLNPPEYSAFEIYSGAAGGNAVAQIKADGTASFGTINTDNRDTDGIILKNTGHIVAQRRRGLNDQLPCFSVYQGVQESGGFKVDGLLIAK